MGFSTNDVVPPIERREQDGDEEDGPDSVLELPTHRLDDPRPSIRKRALEAFGQTVDPRLAVARLQPLGPTLGDGDTREGVQRLLDRLGGKGVP